MKRKNKASSEIAQMLFENYDLNSILDVQNALKDIMGDTIKQMLEVEMDHHIGASKGAYRSDRIDNNYRNGYKNKTVRSSMGELELEVPQDRNSSFNSKIVPKRSKDVSSIEDKIISMYARGTSTRDISATIEEIYGFSIDASMISDITDRVIPIANEWKNRPLEAIYPVVYIDATHFSVRTEDKRVVKKAAYVIMGIDMTGKKDVLSIEIGEAESAKFWLSVLNSLKNRGVKDILILCSDRLKGIKESINAAFPNTIWQGCVIHMIRNTLRFVSHKNKKDLVKDLKSVYTAIDEQTALSNLKEVSEKWNKVYPGLMDRWEDNWDNVSPMFGYGNEFRKLIYTTNAIESLNSQYKRLNKGRVVFPSDQALYKALYLATDVITKKWSSPIRNWGVIHAEIRIYFGAERIDQYIKN